MPDAAPVATTPVAPATAPAGAKPVPPVAAKPTQPVTPPAAAKPDAEDLLELDLDGSGKPQKFTKSQLAALARRGKEGSNFMSAAAKKMAEAEKVRAEAEATIAAFKSGDPAKARAELRKLGYDTRKMSEEELQEAIKDEMLTPEQKELREYKQKLKEKEDAEAEQKRKQDEEAQNQEVAALQLTLAQNFVDAMAKAGIPETHRKALLPRYAELIHAYDKAGQEPSLEYVAEYLADADAKMFDRHLGSLDPAAILQRLGPEKAKALQKHWLQEYQQGKVQKAGGVLPGAPPAKPSTGGGLPPWISKAPADVRNSYFREGEKSPTVSRWLATQQGR